jgi:hypothetical protein
LKFARDAIAPRQALARPGSRLVEIRTCKFGPGSVAIEACVKWVFEQGFDLDLGIGPEDFKGYWSRDNFTAVWSMQIANTRWGLLAFAADNLRQTLSQRVAGLRTTLQPK